MNLKMLRRAADCMNRACLRQEGAAEQIPYYPQKVRAFPLEAAAEMPKLSVPESLGISSVYLEKFLMALEKNKDVNLHNLLVYREGALVCAASAPGYSPRIWCLTHSMAKTVTSFALYLLVGEGKLSLDDKLVDFFAEELPPMVSSRMKKITLRDLLTMGACVDEVNELMAVTLEDWTRAFLASTPFAVPGSSFYYNSINTYMLCAVIERVSGTTTEEVLRCGLFEPMGITQFQIEVSPEGIAKGGWGMFLTPLDMAKLGQLMLDFGMWEGKQLLPRECLEAACLPYANLNADYGAYDYGYHMWVSRDGESLLFNGMLGQNVWISPRNRMVIVTTAGNIEFFQKSATLDIINQFFGKGFSPEKLRRNAGGLARLREREIKFFTNRLRVARHLREHDDPYRVRKLAAIPPRAREILGRYIPEKNRSGAMPLCMRLVANNHTDGITAIAFQIENDNYCIQITEGTITRSFPMGFDEFAYSVQNFKGEPYLVGTACIITENEDGEEVIKVEMVYPEMPNARRFKFYFDHDRVAIAMFETPGSQLFPSVLQAISVNFGGAKASIIDTVRDILGNGEFFQKKLLHCMEPLLFAYPEGIIVDGGSSEMLRSLTYHKRIQKK